MFYTMLDAKGMSYNMDKTASLSGIFAFVMNIFYRICDDTDRQIVTAKVIIIKLWHKKEEYLRH